MTMWSQLVNTIVFVIIVYLVVSLFIFLARRRRKKEKDRTEWTSEGLGWVVFFNKPAGCLEEIGRISDRNERVEFLKKLNEGFFKKLEILVARHGNIHIASKQEFLGSACVIGPENACLDLKREIETDDFATMIKNEYCFTVATEDT